MRTLGNFINGAQVPPAAGRYLDVLEPATGQVIIRVPAGDATDVARAVDAATTAFPAWSESPAAFRSGLLLRIADLIDERLGELAEAESLDTGKPVSLARTLDTLVVHVGRVFLQQRLSGGYANAWWLVGEVARAAREGVGHEGSSWWKRGVRK